MILEQRNEEGVCEGNVADSLLRGSSVASEQTMDYRTRQLPFTRIKRCGKEGARDRNFTKNIKDQEKSCGQACTFT